MKQKEENYVSMVSATLQILTNNQPIWAANAPFSDIVNHITDDVAQINLAQQGSNAVSQGATIDKEMAADDAINRAVRLAGFAQVYALTINNNTLYQQLKIAASTMDKLPDNELTAALQTVYTHLNNLGAVIVPYGVTAVELNLLQLAITTFSEIKSNPRVIIAERKGHNQNIPSLLREIRGSFYKLDKMIKLWEDTNPSFVSDYLNARIIIDLGTRHRPASPPKAL